jgi:putative transposase
VTVAFLDAHRDQFSIAAMCRVLEFSERTFYAAKARPPSARAITDTQRKVLITAEWTANYSCYGARRLHKHLGRQGHTIARCTVARLMAELGIRGVQRGRRQFTTRPDSTADRPPDLVQRDFTADAPNELWLADITYCSTWEGWLYVAFILDVYARVIVGWQIASHMRTDLVIDALEMAAWRRDPSGTCIHHSDAGSQYTSIRYSDRLHTAGIAASVGTVGDSYDNAMAEALNGTFKAELVALHGPWRTRQELEIAVIEWIDWYNHRRLHSEIGDVPPAEHETAWYLQHDLAPAAGNP